MLNKRWWKCAGKRAIRTVAQTIVSMVATGGAAIVLGDVNWVYVISSATVAGILSLLMSIKGLPELNNASNYDYWQRLGPREVKK